MLDCRQFYNALIDHKINFFTGVPDSLLKDFCAYVTDHSPVRNHIITANEGNAVALAAGYYLASEDYPLVYMQNSGQGNAINPLISLADPEVFSIPMLLLIGWRGEHGIRDEPQHVKQGKVTLDLLKTLNIPYEVLSLDFKEAQGTIERALKYMQSNKSPFAIIVRKGTFTNYQLMKKENTDYLFSREDMLKRVIGELEEEDIVISTTGMTSRELFEYRKYLKQDHSRDFLTVGSMGHCSSIALGIALRQKDKKIFCIDGDGAVLMHMGSLAVIGTHGPSNFKHIVFNNGAHDSVGGQPTVGFKVDFCAIAKACGYRFAIRAENESDVIKKMALLKEEEGPAFLEIRVKKGYRKDLGRPTTTPIANKEAFMSYLSKGIFLSNRGGKL